MPEFGCDDIRNPVVTRALAQVRKVVNALVREHGMPDRIHIELAREFNRSFDDRQKIRRDQEENRSLNEAIDKEIESNFGHRAIDPQVYKLWKEQNGRCLYSNQAISPNELMDRLALQIDHALPYSRSYDNGYFNKVLVKTTENQRKGNRTVWEYFRAEKSPDDWERLEAQIQHLPKPKRDRILNQSFGETEQDWKERHLNDTRWITRAVKNHIEKHLDLPVAENQRGVVCLNGSVTHYLRGQWGLNKNRDENARHHGQDAIVIACCTTNMVQRVATYQRYQDRLAGRRPNVPKPWEGFREEVIDKTSQIFVSRAPRRKVTGEINSPNPERTRLNPSTEKVEVIKRVALPSLNLKKLEQLVDKESANQPLYTALKQRLEAFEGKGDKAFKEPFYFAETPHAEPRLVYKVSVWDGPSSGIPVRGGLVSNGDMIRVDVFQKLGKYYLVPVYARDFIIGTLPNRCIVAYKPEEEWPEANEALGYAFLFTLYPNDFVRLTNKEGEVIEGYYVATDRSTASIVIKTHDDSLGFVVANRLSKECKVGVQRLKCFDKYAIGVLGEQTLIKREKRDELANRTDSKSC
jgi:CRISPR-associated endonuclease Csn1